MDRGVEGLVQLHPLLPQLKQLTLQPLSACSHTCSEEVRSEGGGRGGREGGLTLQLLGAWEGGRGGRSGRGMLLRLPNSPRCCVASQPTSPAKLHLPIAIVPPAKLPGEELPPSPPLTCSFPPTPSPLTCILGLALPCLGHSRPPPAPGSLAKLPGEAFPPTPPPYLRPPSCSVVPQPLPPCLHQLPPQSAWRAAPPRGPWLAESPPGQPPARASR